MSNKNQSRMALWVAVVLLAAGLGAVGGYQYATNQAPVTAPGDDSDRPGQQQPNDPPQTGDPQTPEPPTGGSDPTKPNPQEPTSQPSGDAIVFEAYGGGSGSLDVDTAAYSNNSFKVERIEWSEASGTIYVSAKMRAFEAVGYMRVRDENDKILEPESVVRAREGAPIWSNIKGEIPLNPDYEGRVLYVEFFVKSMKDGSRVDILRVPIKPI